MNDALIVGKHGRNDWFMRSDMVAAKMMQKAVAERRVDGEMPLKLLRGEERSEARQELREMRREARAEMRAEAAGRSEEVRGSDSVQKIERARATGGAHEFGQATRLERPDNLANLRERVAEMSRALESLTAAMDAIGEFKFLMAQSDSAGAVAFAGQILADMRSEAAAKMSTDGAVAPEAVDEAAAAEEEGVETVAPAQEGAEPSDNDMITLTGGNVSDVDAGPGDDTIDITATGSVSNIYGGQGHDTITVSAAEISHVYGGNGRDVLTVNGNFAHKIDGGNGNDILNVTATNIQEVNDGHGDDVVTITARDVELIESSRGNDVFNLEVGRANMILVSGNGNDIVNLRDAAHFHMTVADAEGMMGEGSSTTWQGNDLRIDFSNGDSVVINNAANAGSLTLRAGDDVINLTPQVPTAQIMPMLDVNV